MTVSDDRLVAGRGYLADYLHDEEWHGKESEEWFSALADYVDSLTLSDDLIVRATAYLQPFLDDEDRIDCAMYPAGEAVRFLEQAWGGDFRAYLEKFVSAMSADHQRWLEILERDGPAAQWRAND
jgi:hypothetical protein